MKNLTLLAAVIALAIPSRAQITLTAATSNPLPGDTMIYYPLSNVNPGGSGISITWDFSQLTAADRDTLYYNGVPPFPCTVQPLPLYTITYTYPCEKNAYFADSDSFALVAEYGYQSGTNYSDPMLRLIYPMAYGMPIYVDSFKGTTMTSGSDLEFTGYELLWADAYGTLILPDTIYNDVLRVRRQTMTGVRLLGSSGPYSYSSYDFYEWYSESHRTLLLSARNAGTLTVLDTKEDDRLIKVLPNPASNYIIVSTNGIEMNRISINDVTGKTVFIKGNISKDTQLIDVSDYAQGSYFLHIETENETVVKKVQVQ